VSLVCQAETRRVLGREPGATCLALPLVPFRLQLPSGAGGATSPADFAQVPAGGAPGAAFHVLVHAEQPHGAWLVEASFQVQDVPSFVSQGRTGALSLLPCCAMRLTFQLVPIAAGLVALPPLRLVASHLAAKFLLSAAHLAPLCPPYLSRLSLSCQPAPHS